MTFTCAPHPSYPGHCKWRSGISDSPEGKKKVVYFDSHVDCLIVVRKNCAIQVHQKLAMSGECGLCWVAPAPPINHRKLDDLTRRAALDHGSLAVGALRNQGTRGRFLLRSGQF